MESNRASRGEGARRKTGGRVISERGNEERPGPGISGKGQPIAILGVPFDNVTMPQGIARIKEMIASREPHYVVTANVDFLVQAREDVELRHILFDAHLVLCDGTPLIWASRFLGNPLQERVAGSDLVPLLIEESAKKGYRVFFLGATPEAAGTAVARMKQRYPELLIAGHYSPAFNKLLEMDHEEIKRRIREGKPDLLFVSFGCPKQEKWIAMHYRSLGVPVCIGVGATIDFLAGQVKRAPRWMQRTGTEWIFRLLQEPRRLFRRYSKDLRVFAWEILKQWGEMKLKQKRSNYGSQVTYDALGSPSLPSSSENSVEIVAAPERLDLAAVSDGELSEDRMDLKDGDLLLDLSRVEFIDSSGIGWLVGLRKRIRSRNSQLVLVSPSTAVRRALSLMRLEDFFVWSPEVASARRLLKSFSEGQSHTVTLANGSCGSGIEWHGEITAANAEEVWRETVSRLMLKAPRLERTRRCEMTIDLGDVPFIDSTGLGLLIRMKKLTDEQGIGLLFANVNPAVGNVIQIARLEAFLFAENESGRTPSQIRS